MNKTVGRPRSQAADDAILSAATKMFYKQPYQMVSMEAIASEAGVSKATLYRRWPNKSTLAVEVLVRVAIAESVHLGDKPFREHFAVNLKALRDMLTSDYADVIVSVLAEAQNDKQLRVLFIERFLKPVQALGDADLEKAIERGEVVETVDKDLLFDQIFGLFYYRLLIAHKPITDQEIEVIIDAFLTVVSAN